MDRLSKAYSKKLKVNSEEGTRIAVAEYHSIEEATSPSVGQSNESSDHKLLTISEFFLVSHYNFYKNFNYSSCPDPRNSSYLFSHKWGSNCVKDARQDQQRRQYEGNRYDRNNPSQPPTRSFCFGSQPLDYNDSNTVRGYNTIPRNFRFRSSYIGMEKSRRFPKPKKCTSVGF